LTSVIGLIMSDGASRHNTFDEADHAFWVHRAEEFRSAGHFVVLRFGIGYPVWSLLRPLCDNLRDFDASLGEVHESLAFDRVCFLA
jgi:hypothetical protein